MSKKIKLILKNGQEYEMWDGGQSSYLFHSIDEKNFHSWWRQTYQYCIGRKFNATTGTWSDTKDTDPSMDIDRIEAVE